MADLSAETITLKQTIWGLEAELAYQASFGGTKDEDAKILALTDRLRQAQADLKKNEKQVPKP